MQEIKKDNNKPDQSVTTHNRDITSPPLHGLLGQ